MLKGRRVVSGRKERPRVWPGWARGPWAEKSPPTSAVSEHLLPVADPLIPLT